MSNRPDTIFARQRRVVEFVARGAFVSLSLFACLPQSDASTPKSSVVASDTSRSARRRHERRSQSADPDTAQPTNAPDNQLAYPYVPNPKLTPGEAFEGVTAADICVSGYSRKVRDVPSEVKRQAYESYGVRSHAPGEYEVDHLIALQIGGSNSIRNLWPESFRTAPWNARIKDQLEVELHRRVCNGTLDLKTAQQAIANNWVIGYRKYVHPEPEESGDRSNRTNGTDDNYHRRSRYSPPQTSPNDPPSARPPQQFQGPVP